MKTIIAELTANNQVALRYVSRPNCLPPRNLGDSSLDREKEYISELQRKVERTYAIVRNASIEYLHDNSKGFDVKHDIDLHFEGLGKIGEIFHLSKYKGYACTIPKEILFKEVVNGKVELQSATVSELMARHQSALDIIKKSQQTKKYVRPWGRPQTPKAFSRNAKQKILEAGAVIDKHIGSTNAFEVTLTVPGSGYDVYEQVSFWSGYLVNRLTQVIRRAEQKGVKAHWFFVWEHQKRGALHMHWCLAVEGGWKSANLLGLELRAKWFSLLEELSVKTGIDLFRKKGFLGTWRYSPEVWQSRVTRVRESVAAYFSKYCSKNAETRKYNGRRRKALESVSNRNTVESYQCRLLSLCPSRYWGTSARTKRLCKRYRVSISFAVSNSKESHFIYKTIRNWIDSLSGQLTEVSRSFEKACPVTGFIYARGWERKIWFEADALDRVLLLFRVVQDNSLRQTDSIGAIADISSNLPLHLFRFISASLMSGSRIAQKMGVWLTRKLSGFLEPRPL